MLRFPPRRILAAVDSTAASMRAWRAAVKVAARFGAVLDAVYCEAPPPPSLDAYVPSAADAARRRAASDRLRGRLGASAHLHAVGGDPARAIPRLAKDRGYDLVVLGTHRRKGAARLMFGSVAEAVVRSSPCPVLVVPTEMRAIRRVLAPIHAEKYARRALLAAGFVARAHKARLAVLHVVTDPVFGPNPQDLLSSRIAELPAEVRRATRPVGEVLPGAPVGGIVRALRGKDLLVLAAHRKSPLGDWAFGTTAERVLRRSRIPVLTIPAGELPPPSRR